MLNGFEGTINGGDWIGACVVKNKTTSAVKISIGGYNYRDGLTKSRYLAIGY